MGDSFTNVHFRLCSVGSKYLVFSLLSFIYDISLHSHIYMSSINFNVAAFGIQSFMFYIHTLVLCNSNLRISSLGFFIAEKKLLHYMGNCSVLKSQCLVCLMGKVGLTVYSIGNFVVF